MGRRNDLKGKVALVAGATRGAGRGIAVELGAAGAVVYCTGRSSRSLSRVRARAKASRGAKARGAARAEPFALSGRPETIEETAELVSEAGGHGVAVRVDHGELAEVRALIARIEAEHGRLDVLVNDVWGGDELTEWGKPVWELDVDTGARMLVNAVHTHFVTSRCALPLMLRRRGGLVVEITDGDAFYYRGAFFYDLAKTSVIRMAFALAEELRGRDITAVAVTPGFLRSEAMLEHFGVTEASWRRGIDRDPNFAASETPRFVGRAVAALAADPQRAAKHGKLLSSWALAEEYGLTDVDGSTPHWGKHARGRAFQREQRESNERFLAMLQLPK